MRDRLAEALKAQAAEYADIRSEDVTDTRTIYRGPDLDKLASYLTLLKEDARPPDQPLREVCNGLR